MQYIMTEYRLKGEGFRCLFKDLPELYELGVYTDIEIEEPEQLQKAEYPFIITGKTAKQTHIIAEAKTQNIAFEIYAYIRNDEIKYHLPYADYEDSNEEFIACPVCGNPGDYCQDHHHWDCEVCDNPLIINDNITPPQWECEYCEETE